MKGFMKIFPLLHAGGWLSPTPLSPLIAKAVYLYAVNFLSMVAISILTQMNNVTALFKALLSNVHSRADKLGSI